MSHKRKLLTTVVLIVGAIALSASSQARCIPNRIGTNWLQQQENAGGHTIAKHVGKTDLQLLARLAAEPHITGAGSYPTYSSAQSTIRAGIELNAGAINNWANHARNGAKRPYNYDAGTPIGRVATRDDQVNRTSNFRVIFKARGHGTCTLLTSYPTP